MAAYTWTVTNPNGYDGDMVVRQYSSFTLSSGNTLTPNNRSRGVMIWVDGDATIDGTITVYGAYGGTPADTSWNMSINNQSNGGSNTFTNSTSEWGNGSTDANGIHPTLTSIWAKLPNPSGTGSTFFTGQNGNSDASGGVGYGGGATNNGVNNNNQGSPYSGGAGSNGDIGQGDTQQRYGGRGGNGRSGAYPMGSGAGNPSGSPFSGQSFTGGLFVMLARGNINGSGTIDCSGGNGGSAGWGGAEPLYSYGGGGAGGGRIILVAGGTISSNITCDVNGGSGGSGAGSKYLTTSGSRGRHGTVTKLAGVDQ